MNSFIFLDDIKNSGKKCAAFCCVGLSLCQSDGDADFLKTSGIAGNNKKFIGLYYRHSL